MEDEVQFEDDLMGSNGGENEEEYGECKEGKSKLDSGYGTSI